MEAVSDKSLTEISIDVVAKHPVLQWIRLCEQFLNWERKHLLEKEPSRQTLADHRQALIWLLRMTRAIHAQVSDPDFPNRELARELGWKIRRLQESWWQIQDPMPEAEADAILKQAFPE